MGIKEKNWQKWSRMIIVFSLIIAFWNVFSDQAINLTLDVVDFDRTRNEGDSDEDGLSDSYELTCGTNLLDSRSRTPDTIDGLYDSDEDGLVNVVEEAFDTGCLVKDTDFDGLGDMFEVCDSDHDGIFPIDLGDNDVLTFNSVCGNELIMYSYCDPEKTGSCQNNGVDPKSFDTDSDNLASLEVDRGNTSDYAEVCDSAKDFEIDSVSYNYRDICDILSRPNERLDYCDIDGDRSCDNYGTDPVNSDSDDDGLTDGQEKNRLPAINPMSKDTDEDGLEDAFEFINFPAVSPKYADTDVDELNDYMEVCDSSFQFASLYGEYLFEHICSDDDLKWYGCGEDDYVDEFSSTKDDCSAKASNSGSEPNRWDTDRGGVKDGTEVSENKDPTDASDDERQVGDMLCHQLNGITSDPITSDNGGDAYLNMGRVAFGDNFAAPEVLPNNEKACINTERLLSGDGVDRYSIYDIKKWAWSDSTGWISFDCHDWDLYGGDACSLDGNFDYQVQAKFPLDNPLEGFLEGYAWNTKTQWISFSWLEDKLNEAWTNSGHTDDWTDYSASASEFCRGDKERGACFGEVGDFCNQWCEYRPKLRKDDTEFMSLHGYAWSDRAGWLNLEGIETEDWNGVDVWAEVFIRKISHKEEWALGESGDGLDNLIDGKDYSTFAVSGLPLVGETSQGAIDYGCDSAKSEGYDIDDPGNAYNDMDNRCRDPLSGYEIAVGLGFDRANRAILETFDLGLVEVEMDVCKNYDDVMGCLESFNIYLNQAELQDDGTFVVYEGEELKNENLNEDGKVKSALRFGPIGRSADLEDNFAKKTCNILGGGLDCFYGPDDREYNSDKIHWVKTITSAAPSYISGSDFVTSQDNMFKVNSVTVKLKVGGMQKEILAANAQDDLYLCPNDDRSHPEFCGVYNGKFRFLPPLMLNPKHGDNDYITSWVGKALTLDLIQDKNNFMPWHVSSSVLDDLGLKDRGNNLSGIPLEIALHDNNEAVSFRFYDSSGSPDAEAIGGHELNDIVENLSKMPAGIDDAYSWSDANASIESIVMSKNSTDQFVLDPKMSAFVKDFSVSPGIHEGEGPFIVSYIAGMLPKKGIVGLGSNSSAEIKGTVSVKSGIKGKKAYEMDLKSVGDFATSVARDQILRNVADLTGGIDTSTCAVSSEGGVELELDGDLIDGGGCVKDTDTERIIYLTCDDSTSDCGDDNWAYVSIKDEIDLSVLAKNHTIIIEGMNLFVEKDIYSSDNSDSLGVIVLSEYDKNDGWWYGGNMYLNTGSDEAGDSEGVTALYSNMFLDGTLFRYKKGDGNANEWVCDAASCGDRCKDDEGNNLSGKDLFLCLEEPKILGSEAERYLKNQLYIRGSLSSGGVKGGNTIGGTDANPPIIPSHGESYYTRSSWNVERASLYDLNRLSLFRLYLARCNNASPYAIDIKTGSCLEDGVGIGYDAFGVDINGMPLGGDLLIANTTEVYAICELINGCSLSGGVYFGTDFYSDARRSIVWPSVFGMTLKDILEENGKDPDDSINVNAPVYFDYVDPGDKVAGFKLGRGNYVLRY